jgi:cation diffusion facilitator CzcD-associated flavoprotein CzcO
MADVAVIGAGCSGLAALKALREQRVAVTCFERGSDLGGLWRYETDNGLSGSVCVAAHQRLARPHAVPELSDASRVR